MSRFLSRIPVSRLATGVFAAICVLAASSAALAQSRATAPAALPVATEIRLAGDDKETRLVMDVTQALGVRAFTLADPYRVVIDIPQTVFQLPPASGSTGRGLIKAYRYGLVMAGGSRIVIDVSKPVRIEKAAMLESKDGQPARLILDLSATDREAFMRHLALDRTAMRASEASKVPVPQAKPSGDPRPLVVIDPGHGGPDTGTKAGGGEIMEKNVVLDFSIALRDQLEKSGRYRVVMTRTDDTFIPLAERVKFARSRQAQLFISIHADALPRSEGDVQGATVYTLSETASDAEAAKLAEAENRSDVIAGIDLGEGARRRRRYPVRPRPSRDQDFLPCLRAGADRRNEKRHAAAQKAAEIGGLRGAEGPRRALGAGRAGLHDEPVRPEAFDLRFLASQGGGQHGAGGGTVFPDQAGGDRGRFAPALGAGLLQKFLRKQ